MEGSESPTRGDVIQQSSALSTGCSCDLPAREAPSSGRASCRPRPRAAQVCDRSSDSSAWCYTTSHAQAGVGMRGICKTTCRMAHEIHTSSAYALTKTVSIFGARHLARSKASLPFDLSQVFCACALSGRGMHTPQFSDLTSAPKSRAGPIATTSSAS